MVPAVPMDRGRAPTIRYGWSRVSDLVSMVWQAFHADTVGVTGLESHARRTCHDRDRTRGRPIPRVNHRQPIVLLTADLKLIHCQIGQARATLTRGTVLVVLQACGINPSSLTLELILFC